jgi:hypothetical protein
VQRPGLIGILLLAIGVTLLIAMPMDSSWKWPAIMFLLIAGFIMLFISAAQRPSSRRMGGNRTDSGGDGAYCGAGAYAGDGKHRAHGDSGSDSHDGGSGGGDGGGGGGGD